jgi:hypothetical protein
VSFERQAFNEAMLLGVRVRGGRYLEDGKE